MAKAKPMNRMAIENTSLSFETQGMGEPVVLIHGALVADSFRPLIRQTGLSSNYRLITYDRRGYGNSGRASDVLSIEAQAADCRSLMDHLGVKRAHVVGHSLGGSIALPLARWAPEVVNSLVLIEPALAVEGSAEEYRASLRGARRRYREAGAETFVEEFLNARVSGDGRELLDREVPGAFDQAVSDAETAFEIDIAGLLDWTFLKPDAREIAQPVLLLLGRKSIALSPRFQDAYDALLSWLPHAEGRILPDVAHLMPIENPQVVAAMIEEFFERHPIVQDS
ncbi:MAG: alpha/beta hydrolase [Thermomicrobiales bacterium]